jgi:hypothetical protein
MAGITGMIGSAEEWSPYFSTYLSRSGGDRAGTLEKGKLADCIGVEGNPLEDPGAIERVRTVILEGRLVKAKRSVLQA